MPLEDDGHAVQVLPRRDAVVGRRALAAAAMHGLVEESAQDSELEERVERHVVYARASGRVSARASGQALVAQRRWRPAMCAEVHGWHAWE